MDRLLRCSKLGVPYVLEILSQWRVLGIQMLVLLVVICLFSGHEMDQMDQNPTLPSSYHIKSPYLVNESLRIWCFFYAPSSPSPSI